MVIANSPGCGCCDPCKATETAFTPTTPIDRGLVAWAPSTAYTAGDKVHHVKLSDGESYQWNVDSNRTSGSSWDASEEAAHTQEQRADLYDEVTEWDLYGSDWANLTEDELDDYLRYGKLAVGLGYISKSDVLPSVTNWKTIFDFVGFGRDGSGGIAPGLKIRLWLGLTLDSDEPDDYFLVDSEWIDTSQYNPENSIVQYPIKISIGEVESGGGVTIWDETYSTANQSSACRRPEISGGTFLGGADPATDTLDSLTGNGLGNRAFWKGVAYTATAAGTFAGSPGLTVLEDDVIVLTGDHTDPTDAANWTTYTPPTTPGLTDVFTAQLTKEDPDADASHAGKKVGIYIVAGQPADFGKNGYQSPDIWLFNRVTSKLQGTITTPECEVCARATPCPCSDDDEYSEFMELAVSSGGLSAASGTYNFTEAVGATTWHNWHDPSSGYYVQGVTGSSTIDGGDISIGSLSVAHDNASQRNSLCSFTFRRAASKVVTVDDDPDTSFYRTVRCWYYEVITGGVSQLPNGQFEIGTTATMYAGAIRNFFSSSMNGGAGHFAINEGTAPGDLSDPGDVDWDNDIELYFLNLGIYEIASGSGSSIVSSFDCGSFSLMGTYDTDLLTSRWNGLKNGGYLVHGPPSNGVIGSTWTIQNA